MRRKTTTSLLAGGLGMALLLVACGDDDQEQSALSVRAVDYEFEGLPDRLDAGSTRLQLVNEGAEAHELVLFRRNDEVTQPVDELLSLPEEEVSKLVTQVTRGETLTALPRRSATDTVELRPGRYIAVCLIPVGTTNFDAEPPAGPPHAARGMVKEVTVE